MDLKNLNRFLILLFLFFILSCQTIDNFRNIEDVTLSTTIDEIENIATINNTIIINSNNIVIDNFSQPVNFFWQNGKVLNKKISINKYSKEYPETIPLNIFLINDKIYSFDYDLSLKVYNLNDGALIDTYNILINSNNELTYPTSIAKINKSFYAGFANGTVINFDINGNILWQKSFNDILKTPIKIHNKNIIVLLSNKIISINSSDGEINWEFIYDQDNPLNVFGGSILSKNHLLYFFLPNKRLGEIDTVIGEKIVSLFSNIKLDKNLTNFNNSIHFFQNSISLFENNKYLHTIDVKNNEFLVNKNKIDNVTSHNFINNTLITLNKNKILKASNINNNKVFWKIDVDDYVSKNSEIIKIINNKKIFIIFFTNGHILEINYLNGEILSEQNIKIKNIKAINFYEKYVITSQNNGKITLFRQ